MRHKTSRRPTTTRIHNEMDELVNKLKKYSYYRNEGQNRSNCPYKN